MTSYYPEPSAYNLNKLLHSLKDNPEKQSEFTENMEEIMKQYNLTPEQADAMRKKDAVKLGQLGAHPVLIRKYVPEEIEGRRADLGPPTQ